MSSLYCKVLSFAVCLCRECKTPRRGNNLSAMKTKLKRIVIMATLAFAATACGSSMSKPASGFDLSAFSPGILSIGPKISDQAGEPAPVESKTENHQAPAEE